MDEKEEEVMIGNQEEKKVEEKEVTEAGRGGSKGGVKESNEDRGVSNWIRLIKRITRRKA